jgi:hypothetical protein
MNRAAHRVHPTFGYWALRLLLLLPLGLLSLLIAVFAPLDSDMHPVDKAIGSSIFVFFSFIVLYPVFEAVRMNVFHRRKMITDEMTDEMRRASPTGLSVDWSWKGYPIAALFGLFFVGPLLGRDNEYSLSTPLVVVVWLIIFPAVLLLDAYLARHVHFERHRMKIWLLKAFFYAFLVLMLLGHIGIAMDWRNSEPVSMTVIIRDVSRDSCAGRSCFLGFLYCSNRASVTDEMGRMRSFCIDKLQHNLVRGRSAYQGDGQASIAGRRSWAGVVVDSVVWKRPPKAKSPA